jgi:hypothetical protein
MIGKPIFVLISGKAGVGKSTSAELLKEIIATNSSEKVSTGIFNFAKGVKYAAKQGFGWDGLKDERGRKLLQDIGAIGRKYDKDTWVKQLIEYIWMGFFIPPEIIIIDDWRFPNELAYLEKQEIYSIYTVRIESSEKEILRGTDAYNDVSETSLPSVFPGEDVSYYDFIIHNNEDIKELTSKLILIYKSIKNKENIK